MVLELFILVLLLLDLLFLVLILIEEFLQLFFEQLDFVGLFLILVSEIFILVFKLPHFLFELLDLINLLLQLVGLVLDLLFEGLHSQVGDKQALGTHDMLDLLQDLFVWLIGILFFSFELADDIFLVRIDEVRGHEQSK